MKKVLIGICTVIGIISFPYFGFSEVSKYEAESTSMAKHGYQTFESTLEEHYWDISITLLYPYIQNAINDYYKNYLKDIPSEDPWSIKTISIERLANYKFLMQFEVTPYIGPHNSVGRDRIALRVELFEGVTVEKFEHIESFPIPPNYKDIIIKWPPQ